jgi:hypothetical protein
MSEDLNVNHLDNTFVSDAEFPGTIDDIRVSFDFESPHYYDDESGTPVYNDSECETPHYDDEEGGTPTDVPDDKNTPDLSTNTSTHERPLEKRGRRQVIPDAALAIALGGYSFECYADPVSQLFPICLLSFPRI